MNGRSGQSTKTGKRTGDDDDDDNDDDDAYTGHFCTETFP